MLCILKLLQLKLNFRNKFVLKKWILVFLSCISFASKKQGCDSALSAAAKTSQNNTFQHRTYNQIM